MRLIFILVLLQHSCWAFAQTHKSDSAREFKVERVIDSLKKQGVRQYLVYEVICAGACEFLEPCKCKDNVISSATLYYQLKEKYFKRNLECCSYYSPVEISNDFFKTLIRLSDLYKEANKNKKPKFYPPVATDQVEHKFIFYTKGIKFDFALSENQITTGTEEQKIWEEYEEFKVRKQIFDFVQNNK